MKKLTNPTPVKLPSGSWRCQVMVNGQRVSVTEDFMGKAVCWYTYGNLAAEPYF